MCFKIHCIIAYIINIKIYLISIVNHFVILIDTLIKYKNNVNCIHDYSTVKNALIFKKSIQKYVYCK